MPANNFAIPLLQLVIETMEDLHKLYPEIVPKGKLEMRMAATEQVWDEHISGDRMSEFVGRTGADIETWI